MSSTLSVTEAIQDVGDEDKLARIKLNDRNVSKKLRTLLLLQTRNDYRHNDRVKLRSLCCMVVIPVWQFSEISLSGRFPRLSLMPTYIIMMKLLNLNSLHDDVVFSSLHLIELFDTLYVLLLIEIEHFPHRALKK